MANAAVVASPTIRLVTDLSPFEAEVLKGVMQNPINDPTICQESVELANIRTAIFNALKNAGVP